MPTLLCAAALLSACQERPAPSLLLGATAKEAHGASGAPDGAAAIRYLELVRKLNRPTDAPLKMQRSSCPAELGRLERAESSVLALSIRDARMEAKQLLPLVIRNQLESRPLAELGLADNEDPALTLASYSRPEQIAEALSRLQQLEHIRYKGVFQILSYQEPKVIRRIGKLKPEWLPGILSAVFVVIDLSTGEALCQSDVLIAQSQVQGEPISKRLRSTIRERLVRQLGSDLRARAGEALAQIAPGLKLP